MKNKWFFVLESLWEEVLPAIGVVGFLPSFHYFYPAFLPNIAFFDALLIVSYLVLKNCQLKGSLNTLVVFTIEIFE